MSDYFDPIAAAVLAFWHALSSSEKTTIIAASVGSITTILTATIGALVVLWQIGRQARNAINQSRHDEALKLKLEVYKDIIGVSRAASDAIEDLSSFVRRFHSTLLLAQQTQSELGGHVIPSFHPSQIIEKKSQVDSSNI